MTFSTHEKEIILGIRVVKVSRFVDTVGNPKGFPPHADLQSSLQVFFLSPCC